MNIHIELEDPKRCDFCPLLKEGEVGAGNSYCRLFGLAVYRYRNNLTSQVLKHERPKKCIEENGK